MTPPGTDLLGPPARPFPNCGSAAPPTAPPGSSAVQQRAALRAAPRAAPDSAGSPAGGRAGSTGQRPAGRHGAARPGQPRRRGPGSPGAAARPCGLPPPPRRRPGEHAAGTAGRPPGGRGEGPQPPGEAAAPGEPLVPARRRDALPAPGRRGEVLEETVSAGDALNFFAWALVPPSLGAGLRHSSSVGTPVRTDAARSSHAYPLPARGAAGAPTPPGLLVPFSSSVSLLP